MQTLIDEFGPAGLGFLATVIAAVIAATAAFVNGIVRAVSDDVLAKRQAFRNYRMEMIRPSLADVEARLASVSTLPPRKLGGVYVGTSRPPGRRVFLTPDDDLGEIAAAYSAIDFMCWMAADNGLWEGLDDERQREAMKQLTVRAMTFREALEEFVFGGSEARKFYRRHKAEWLSYDQKLEDLLGDLTDAALERCGEAGAARRDRGSF